jgi:hypothetical protein
MLEPHCSGMPVTRRLAIKLAHIAGRKDNPLSIAQTALLRKTGDTSGGGQTAKKTSAAVLKQHRFGMPETHRAAVGLASAASRK